MNKLVCWSCTKEVGNRSEKTEEGEEARGTFTDNVIDAMQTNYGKAIRSNRGDMKAMQKATWVILYHQSSTTTKTRHEYCPPGPTLWCKYIEEPSTHGCSGRDTDSVCLVVR